MKPPATDLRGTPDPGVMVLFHGAALNRLMWVLIGREVASAWPALAPDRPGHCELAERSFLIGH